MTVIGLLLVGAVLFVLACLVIAARRGLWLKVEIDQPAETRTVVHRHVHRHVHYREVAHHHYLHTNPAMTASARPAMRGGLLARAVLPRPPAAPAVDPRLVQHVYDPKETQ
ncbi:MAG: hypothetical protein GEV07_30110 [Streptosporangiales bacterium]|nr:hypothetical protein [Streptosporangiales bacterium]